MTAHIVHLTEAAKTHIRRKLIDIDKPYLIFGLKGGGCAGFEYFWVPADQEEYNQNGTPDRDDFIDLGEDKKLVVDCTSHVYLIGSEIDYKSDFISSALVVDNPMAQGSCGCGTSVSFG
jgi:iron-sulfur cluster assembly accessory protein